MAWRSRYFFKKTSIQQANGGRIQKADIT